MLKTLLKKQLMEVFRMYFFDSKKKRALSKRATIVRFILYAILMFGVISGSFTIAALFTCPLFFGADYGWMYFAIFGVVSLFMGVFGSVFTTYSSLYLSKDNDLMLSLPIPVGKLILARILNVYILGLLYSLVIILPVIIVYLIMIPQTIASVIGCLLMIVHISVLVLILSCLLGWVVARISLKLKNKSFITVIISLVFFGVYYFVCFKAGDLIQSLIEHLDTIGESLKHTLLPLYYFGLVGLGDWLAILIVTAVIGALFVIIWLLMKKSFFRIITSNSQTNTQVSAKKAAKEANAAQKTPFKALFAHEMSRFTSSANYMLNCGLGVVFMLLLGVVLLIKGPGLISAAEEFLEIDIAQLAPAIPILIGFCFTMVDTAVPSVSLEGKNIWVVKSLPVTTWEILKAKMGVQLVLSVIPALFVSLCAVVIFPSSIIDKIFIILNPVIMAVFAALMFMTLGLKHVNLNWTNETEPIKQSMGVMIAMFGGWGYMLILGGLFAFAFIIHLPWVFSILCAILNLALSFIIYNWLRKSGVRIFNNL